MKIIDPHIHLLNIEQGDYAWLKENNPPFWPDKQRINKTFIENDLLLESPLGLAGFVHVEAGFDNNQPERELDWLEKHCQKPFVSIAAIDLTKSSKGFSKQIEKLIKYRSLVGVRHILDEQALLLLTNKQVQQNFNLLNDYSLNGYDLNKHGLTFEVQMPLSQSKAEHAPVKALCDVIGDNSEITFIINHSGFPPADIHTIEWQRWQSNLVKLAMFPHTAIKCSGWEMTDRHYQPAWLNDNLALIFNIFGVERMMLASNFPLCLFSKSSYHDYWHSLLNLDFFQTLTEQEKSALCYDNALKYYHLSTFVT